MYMNLPFDIPDKKKIRLIINTDAKNEADDQFAIVHALLTPRFKIKGIIAANFTNGATMLNRTEKNTMQASYDEIENVLSHMNLVRQVPVYRGAEKAIADETTPEISEGAQAIIREALVDDPAPLFVVFLGPLTDLASAYLMEPEIAEKLTAVWIGGGPWPNGGWEFNLFNDLHAANVVFQSKINLWQVPQDVYATMRVSIAELVYKVKPYGEIGNYLYQQLVEFNDWAARSLDIPWPKGETWSLGDSPAIGLLLDDHDFGFELKPAPRITKDFNYEYYQNERFLRVYHYVDSRFILEDLFAKLALNYGK